MQLILIYDEQPSSKVIRNLIEKIAQSSLLALADSEIVNSLPDRFITTISNTEIESYNINTKESPRLINLYGIKKQPCLILINDGQELCRWENQMPTASEIVKTIKGYLLIIDISTPEIDFDVDE